MFGILRILFSQPQACMSQMIMFLILEAILAVLFFLRSLKGRSGKRSSKMFPFWFDELMFDGIFLKQYDAKMPTGLSQLSVVWLLL